jgi:hypothetical protein
MTRSLVSISAGDRSKRNEYQNPLAVFSLVKAISNASWIYRGMGGSGL